MEPLVHLCRNGHCESTGAMGLKLAIKKAIVKTICSPPVAEGIFRRFDGQIPFRGLVIDTRHPHVPRSVVPRLYWKLYERAEVDFVSDYLRPDLPAIELGGCLGVVACCVARKQKDRARLISVEANPHLREVILKNLNRNQVADNVEVMPGAIDFSGEKTAQIVVAQDAVGTHVQRDVNCEKEQGTETVPAVQLGSLLTEHGIDGDYALVCDIESAEADIILSGHDALANCQQIIMEFHPGMYAAWDTNYESLRDRILSWGFEIKAIRGDVVCFERS